RPIRTSPKESPSRKPIRPRRSFVSSNSAARRPSAIGPRIRRRRTRRSSTSAAPTRQATCARSWKSGRRPSAEPRGATREAEVEHDEQAERLEDQGDAMEGASDELGADGG